MSLEQHCLAAHLTTAGHRGLLSTAFVCSS